jgi:hypothetical protein
MQFTTLEQVRDYLSRDRIERLVCGRKLLRLQYKHLEMHGLDADAYRERFGIPWTFSLTSATSRARSRASNPESNLRNWTRHEGERPGQLHRKPCLAVALRWAREAELGRDINARRYVTVSCSGGCGTLLETTALTAVPPIFCGACATPYALRARRAYARKKARTALEQREAA